MKDTKIKRYLHVEDLPASIVRQARVGHVMEQAIQDVIGAPCRIIDSYIDLEQVVSTFEIDIPSAKDHYLDSVTLTVYGKNAEMTAVRVFSVKCPYNMTCAIKRGSMTNLDILKGYDPRLDIDVCEDAIILTLSVAGMISDIPRIDKIAGVLRIAEFAMMKT
ncbi:MAG: hypothetical protein EB828_00425 [Nitrosopumilus sp. D6]|nr:MAG: hypothetical protein EB828_00425 [Nitrosopumilus sp. D6]